MRREGGEEAGREDAGGGPQGRLDTETFRHRDGANLRHFPSHRSLVWDVRLHSPAPLGSHVEGWGSMRFEAAGAEKQNPEAGDRKGSSRCGPGQKGPCSPLPL